MTSRFLLTLLALLSGLAVQGAAVHGNTGLARGSQVGSIASIAPAKATSNTTVNALGLLDQTPVSSQDWVEREPEQGSWIAPSVLPGVDRARE